MVCFAAVAGIGVSRAQLNVGSTSAPNTNAMLQVSGTTKGVLLPNVALTSTTSPSPLSAHVQGMIVYNTATSNDVSPGLYINDGTKWASSALANSTGGSSVPAQAGSTLSKSMPIDVNTTANSRMKFGNVVFRYNGSNTDGNLEMTDTASGYFFVSYANYGTSGSAGTYYENGTGTTAININQWSAVYSFGNIENTEGSTTHITVVESTGKVTQYTISAQVILAGDMGLSSDQLILKITQDS